MGAIIAVLLILGAVILTVFVKFGPEHANQSQVTVFNWMVLGVCALVCLSWYAYVSSSLRGLPEEKWIMLVGVGGAVGIEIVFLFVCLLLRNFWVFKPPSRPGDLF